MKEIQGKSILVRVGARFSEGWSYREPPVCLFSFKATMPLTNLLPLVDFNFF